MDTTLAIALGICLSASCGFRVFAPFLVTSIAANAGYLNVGESFGWLGGWALAYAATGAAVRTVGSEQRRFAQSALGKYLPRDIAAQLVAGVDLGDFCHPPEIAGPGFINLRLQDDWLAGHRGQAVRQLIKLTDRFTR